ncbi:MAG TPA: 4-hydroxy-tetrahydrodipicolinate synthase, partial [Beijerinckiaceae bacterium]|nr:4-hydroxy-tetrahydrodipicolinate synthase [Beijerinckiaceae bacterium]
RFRGSMTALVTPFREGALDETAFRALVGWQIEQGTQGLVPVGTTGESPTLSHEEHRRVVEVCVTEARGRVPVIAGAGSNNTSEAVELARHAERAGADAVLVVTPYYNKPNQEGLFQHFKAIDAAIGIPIVIYNIPPRSVIDMSVETMTRCFELRNVVGVKDATGNVGRISIQRQAMGADFLQFSGDDITALSCMAAGAHGCISVISNAAPRLCADLQSACLSGDFQNALRIQDRLVPLDIAVFLEAGVTGAKYALSLLGKVGEEVRLPLVPCAEPTRRAIRDAMIYAGLLNA